MMSLGRIKHFKSVINSKKFHNDLKENRMLLNNLHTLNFVNEDFVWFLCAYPLSDGNKKIIKKLDGKRKFGVLSRHLMGVAKKLGIGDMYLRQYHELKANEKYYNKNVKKESWKYYWNDSLKPSETTEQRLELVISESSLSSRRDTYSSILFSATREMLDFCFSKYNSREDKISQILDN